MKTPMVDESPTGTNPTGPAPEGGEGAECHNCTRTARETAQNEEINLAFLLALVPVISLTFFGQLGLL